MLRKLLKFTTTLLTVASSLTACSDSSGSKGTHLDASGVRLILDSEVDMLVDLNFIDFVTPDAYVDPCLNADSSSEVFCECQPQCCQIQQWYCPPNGLGVNALEVVMNICDDNLEPCDRSNNFNCPPPEVLSQGSCRSILECPPSIDNDITITVRCEIDGVEGTQRILCTKGSIQYEECITCTPSEERCNFADDDCDGQVDEGQRNECNTCGPLPSETCNGVDDDCDGPTDENLIQECESACERGFEVCQGGNWVSCTAVQPTEEECDGMDNDCDGQIDEELNCLCNPQDVGNLQPCTEPPLRCGQGFKMCDCVDEECTELRMTECLAFCNYFPQEGQECDPFLGMAIAAEQCNAFDEDCDELLDENLTQACYTGDPETLNVGVCEPGMARCELGAWGSDRDGIFIPGFCDGEVTPSDEVCDGADNDCDGEIDYGQEIRDMDILFIIDWSGSMDSEIAAVRTALNQFAQQFAAEEALQWGLIIGPSNRNPTGGMDRLIKVSDIETFDNFLQSFASLGQEDMNGGQEMLKDAIYFAVQNISPAAILNVADRPWTVRTSSTPEKENFGINWREDAERVVIVFTDEYPQSYLTPPISNGMLVNVVRAAINLKLYAFVDPGWEGDEWEEIALAGNGQRFRLTANANNMYNDLMSIIDDACLPPVQQASNNQQDYVPASYHNRYDYVNGICF